MHSANSLPVIGLKSTPKPQKYHKSAMLLFKIIALLFTFVICADSHPQSSRSDVNYDNLRRFMNQSPENLAKTLQLLENPYIAAALVKSNRTPEFGGSTEKTLSTAEAPREETNKLLDFLLTQRSSPTYRIRKPAISLVPPEVDTRGILNDPLLGSFFQNTKEDLPPLEVRDTAGVRGTVQAR